MQIFTSGALNSSDGFYWVLIVFVGGVITIVILAMFILIIFESYRAFKYSKLYEDVRCVCVFVYASECVCVGVGEWREKQS